jgi:hypothetical protein
MQNIVKKFKFKDSAIVINATPSIEEEFLKLGFKNKFVKNKSTNTLVFINDSKEYFELPQNRLNKHRTR